MRSLLGILLFAGAFLLIWFGLSQVQWVKTLKIEEKVSKNEQKLANLILKIQRQDKKEYTDKTLLQPLNTIKRKICNANNIETDNIKIYVFEDDVMNAYALPGGNIVINSALLKECDNPDMFAGVLSHEIAHVELSHVSKKLAKEIGLATIAGATGAGNGAVIREILYTLTSKSYDRDIEREADAQAVIYMKAAKADVKEFANMMQKFANKSPDLPTPFEWISTHPDSKERAETILSEADSNAHTIPLVKAEAWQELLDHIAEQ